MIRNTVFFNSVIIKLQGTCLFFWVVKKLYKNLFSGKNCTSVVYSNNIEKGYTTLCDWKKFDFPLKVCIIECYMQRSIREDELFSLVVWRVGLYRIYCIFCILCVRNSIIIVMTLLWKNWIIVRSKNWLLNWISDYFPWLWHEMQKVFS